MREKSLLKAGVAAVLSVVLGACAGGDRAHVAHVSVPQQRMTVFEHGRPIASYPVSTSKFGLGDVPGSNRTPLGQMAVAQKIGAGVPVGMKFKSRQPTGEIVAVNAPGRDPIVTRILWLRGLEPCNARAYERMIYIHGTPEESRLGTPASFGCIRMRSRDVVQLFDTLGKGARVIVSNAPAPADPAAAGQTAGFSAPAAAAAQNRVDSPAPARTAASARD
jgi:lipoprotein-anchoring transpeptidase ErfK/SrfK